MTTINSGRYASSVATIPALETPNTISRGGSQQQLDAMIAETTVPTLAIRSARTGPFDWPSDVAPGNVAPVLSQQSGAGLTGSWRSSDTGIFPCSGHRRSNGPGIQIPLPPATVLDQLYLHRRSRTTDPPVRSHPDHGPTRLRPTRHPQALTGLF